MSNAGEQFKSILAKLQSEEKRKEDISAPINGLRMIEDFTFESQDLGKVKMTDHAFGQLCQQAYNYSLPADYFRNLYKENPQRATEQLNYHLEKARGVNRRFRTIQSEDGSASEIRGIVSESYIPYDNIDALNVFMDTMKDRSYEVMTSHVSDKMMFMRFIFPELQKNFGRAYDGQEDKNFLAIDLVNSEVGYTSVIANPSIFRLICENGLVSKQAEYGNYKQRHMHIDPLIVNDDLRKSIIHGFDMGKDILHSFEQSRKIKVADPYEMITDYGRRKAMADKLIKTVRENYEIEADRSLFGVVNAFTRTAKDIKSLDRRLELEKYASVIMEKELKKSA